MKDIYGSQAEYLTDILQLCSMRLSRFTEEPATDEQICAVDQGIRRKCERTVDQGSGIGLEYLFRVFNLTDFERHCVMLALAGDLNSEYGDLYACRQSGTLRPTLALCLESFTADRQEQIDLHAQWLRRGDTLAYFFDGAVDELRSVLNLHNRVVSFALDFTSEDPELQGVGGVFWPEEQEPLPIRQDLLKQMERFSVQTAGEKLLYYLTGAAGAGRKTLVKCFCAHSGRTLVWVDVAVLLKRKAGWDALLRPFLRETKLRNAVLAVLNFEKLQDGTSEKEGRGDPYIRYLLQEAARMTDCLCLLSNQDWHPADPCTGWKKVELRLEMPSTTQRLALWKHCVADKNLNADVSLESLANKFSLLPGQITAAARKAEELRCWAGEEQITSEIIHQACRDQLPSRIGTLAHRVNAVYRWEDLILPPEQKEKLKEACNQVEYRRQVYEDWGLGKKLPYGRGVSMLFSGPPGTGKTMAAQVIASCLQLELYKVDLSGVMSKYVGETEKQLGAVFDEVKKSQSILFFDEADALFGKRSEVRDSHDRYANVQTSYLLQKIEEYDGIVILASNFVQNFDEAFKRRIKFIIDFTLPDQERREQIWRAVMLSGLPVSEDVDFEFLARSFELSGSSIKNVAVSAAFLAAADGTEVHMAHLLVSVQAEQQKAGKSISREDFGEYYRQISDYQKQKMQSENGS